MTQTMCLRRLALGLSASLLLAVSWRPRRLDGHAAGSGRRSMPSSQVDVNDAGMRGRRGRRRQGGASEGLRDGRPRARRAECRRHDLRGRLGFQAVHRRGRPAAGARRQAVARRPGAEDTFPSCPTTASRCPSGTCCSTRAACATGARWRRSRAGPAPRASTPTPTSSTSSRGRSRSTSSRGPTGPTATPATTSRPSSCRV